MQREFFPYMKDWEIDPKRTMAMVSASGNMMKAELARWLVQRFGQQWGVFDFSNTDLVCVRNRIMDTAIRLPADIDHIVFADNDIMPDERADEMFKLTTDVKACRVEFGNDKAWSEPDEFHEALWCVDRWKLASIKPPWNTGAEHDELMMNRTSCSCEGFKRRAQEFGLTFSHAGYCPHENSGSWCG